MGASSWAAALAAALAVVLCAPVAGRVGIPVHVHLPKLPVVEMAEGTTLDILSFNASIDVGRVPGQGGHAEGPCTPGGRSEAQWDGSSQHWGDGGGPLKALVWGMRQWACGGHVASDP